MRTVYLGRQPIFNRELESVACELLYRGGDTDRAGRNDARASASVLINTFIEMGAERVIGRSRAFVHMTPELLDDKLLSLFDPAQLVLQLMPDLAYDQDVLERVDQLRAAGYGISVDDLLVHEGTLPLIERAHFIKVDISAIPREELGDHVAELRRHPAALVAEKVETHEQFALCRALGFDFYQGHFFARPNLVAGRALGEDRLSVMHLLSALHNPAVELNEVQEIIQRSVSLSYRLLRYVNSAAYNLPRKIESIAQAAVVLGQRRLRDMVTLLALTGADDRPQALTHVVLTRAQVCARLAQSGRGSAEMAFTVGLFSGLDALMDLPVEELLAQLPLADETCRAILHREGPLGQVLDAALALERGDQQSAALAALAPSPAVYWESADWATQALRAMA
jgi:EAL and modified HD-GYP domain-containing signal transduction protein